MYQNLFDNALLNFGLTPNFFRYIRNLSFMRVCSVEKGDKTYKGVAELPYRSITATFESEERVPAPLADSIGADEPVGTNLMNRFIAGIIEDGELTQWFFCPSEVKWICNIPVRHMEELLVPVMRRIAEVNKLNNATGQKVWQLHELLVLGKKAIEKAEKGPRQFKDITFEAVKPYLVPPTDAVTLATHYGNYRQLFNGISKETVELVMAMAAPKTPDPKRDWVEIGDRNFRCQTCNGTIRLGNKEYKSIYLMGTAMIETCKGCHLPNFVFKGGVKAEAKLQAVPEVKKVEASPLPAKPGTTATWAPKARHAPFEVLARGFNETANAIV